MSRDFHPATLFRKMALRLLNPVFTELGDPKVPRGSILAYHVAQTCIVLKGLRWEHSEPKIGPNSLKWWVSSENGQIWCYVVPTSTCLTLSIPQHLLKTVLFKYWMIGMSFELPLQVLVKSNRNNVRSGIIHDGGLPSWTHVVTINAT